MLSKYITESWLYNAVQFGNPSVFEILLKLCFSITNLPLLKFKFGVLIPHKINPRRIYNPQTYIRYACTFHTLIGHILTLSVHNY